MSHANEKALGTSVLPAWWSWTPPLYLKQPKRLTGRRLVMQSSLATLCHPSAAVLGKDDERPRRPTSVIVTLLLILVTILVATKLALLPNFSGGIFRPTSNLMEARKSSPSTTVVHDCGLNTTEAQARGCIFDLLSLQWTPPACYNRTLATQPLRPDDELATALGGTGNFSFHSNDESHTTLSLPLEGPATVRTTVRFHRAHCSYLWRLALAGLERASAGESDVLVLENAVQWRHSLHCNKILLERRGRLDEEELFYVGLGRCVNISPMA